MRDSLESQASLEGPVTSTVIRYEGKERKGKERQAVVTSRADKQKLHLYNFTYLICTLLYDVMSLLKITEK